MRKLVGGWRGLLDTFVHAPLVRRLVPQKTKERVCGQFDAWLQGEMVTPNRNRVVLVGGQILVNVHDATECEGDVCAIHRPSAHHMVGWQQNWRSDRRMMERICSHGVGHPDPDDWAVRVGVDQGIHGCDSCCRTPNPGAS